MTDSAKTGPSDGLVLQVGGTRQFLAVAAVVEVLREVRLIRVPGAGPAVRGMTNHRGRILVVADAARALALGETVGDRPDVVVAEAGGRRFGIAVDRVVELSADARTGLAELELDRIAGAIFT